MWSPLRRNPDGPVDDGAARRSGRSLRHVAVVSPRREGQDLSRRRSRHEAERVDASFFCDGSGAVAQVPEVDLKGIDAELRKHPVEPLHLKCVSQDYEGPLETARYVNRCSQPLHLTIVFGNTDDVREMDLPEGKSRNLNFTLLDYAQRKGSSWYVCPKGTARST